MKQISYYIGVLLLCIVIGATSCNNDISIDREHSIFVDNVDANEIGAFDTWVEKNYTDPYNISFKYRMEHRESSMQYVLTPADYHLSVFLAKVVKYVWLEAYDEVTGSPNFMRKYVPKTIHLIGSPAYENNGTMVLGTAEGGMKITLYNVNSIDTTNIDINYLNEMYFHTMHHEFAHILHQTKNYDASFDRITENAYVGSDWYIYTDPETGQSYGREDSQAWKEGFVTPYSMSQPREDFVEIISVYITRTPSQWASMLQEAGKQGASIINRKFSIVYNYMLQTWGIDLNRLREIVLRRQGDIENHLVDLSTIN